MPLLPRRCGRSSRVSTAGAVRLTASCSSQSARRSRSTGAEVDHAGHVQQGVDSPVDLATEPVEGARVGEVGDQDLGPLEGVLELGRAGVVAGDQHERVAPVGEPVGQREPDARTGAGEDVLHRAPPSPREHDLAEDVALGHRREAVARVLHRDARGR